MTAPAPPDKTAFVTFACAKDVHYAKALLGSIRHFYPNHEIHLVLDADVPRRDAEQLRRFPHVHAWNLAHLPEVQKLNLKGLLAKLSVFYIPGITSALVADADSILAGPVLENIDRDCVLNSLNSMTLDIDVPAQREMFIRWAFDLKQVEAKEGLQVHSPCPFVQGSHFYIDVTRFPKELIHRLLPEMTHSHSPTHMLRAGDQGFWNYVANFGDDLGIHAIQQPMTLQVGFSPHCFDYDDISYVNQRIAKDFYFIHYVGSSRRYLRRHHEYAAALAWGTDLYYSALGKTAFVRDELSRALRTATRAVRCMAKIAANPIHRKDGDAR